MLAAPVQLHRAAILNPLDPSSWNYREDGVCAVQKGSVLASGSVASMLAEFPKSELVEHDGVLLPGFTDLHCHWVQHAVRGAYSGELLQWLQEYIWPEEGRFVDEALARKQVKTFYSDMLRAGTVMGLSFSSVHRAATEVALAEMRGDWVVGNALMAINAPAYLTRYSQHEAEELNTFVENVSKEHYAITPRFAPNMRAQDLRVAGQIADAQNLLVQTHLAESRAELCWVKELFPEAESYTDVYDRAGLLGPRTVLAHCIEMSDAEWACLADRGSWVAHCPSSNEALGNSRMPLEKLREYGIPWALASDIGAGPSHSMLHVLQRFFAVHESAGLEVSATEGLYRATLAGAAAMGRAAVAGNLMPGKRADFIVMPGKPKAEDLTGWFRDLCEGKTEELERRPLETWLSGKRIEPQGVS
ncbi:amidohydrolase family protein [Acidithiobacillus sp. IBUN Pt1247-S3]|uniref:amidohydrolase family protein n=1 Tax=Acidithiobacillus sp. IBUN Pt1247-S3 TaxID=3166642 RepID=UPI0034E5111D